MGGIFDFLLMAVIAVMGMTLIRVIKGPDAFDRLNGIFAIGIDVIVALLIAGFAGGRQDEYVDIALSYGIVSFLSVVIIARYLGEKASKGEEEKDEPNPDGRGGESI